MTNKPKLNKERMKWKDLFPKENRYFETENGILYCGDCLETMSKFPKKIFDAIITDPPYGTTACKWDVVISFEDMWRELKRIRKDRTPIVLFGSEPFSSLLRVSNLKEFKYDWIWEKPQGVDPFMAKYRPLNNYEIISIFYKKFGVYNPQFEKGKPYVIERDGKPRIMEVKQVKMKSTKTVNDGYRYPKRILKFKQERGLHPTQKPLALMEYLIKTYTNDNGGALILDFTCGSGTTLVACEKLNRRWVGIELEERYCGIAKKRIEEIAGQRGLFEVIE
jgi:site-specific DNA-methyltransferase (adenine-specific)